MSFLLLSGTERVRFEFLKAAFAAAKTGDRETLLRLDPAPMFVPISNHPLEDPDFSTITEMDKIVAEQCHERPWPETMEASRKAAARAYVKATHERLKKRLGAR